MDGPQVKNIEFAKESLYLLPSYEIQRNYKKMASFDQRKKDLTNSFL